MKEFKKCEKETKTKAYSKEGLRQPSKQSPQDVSIAYGSLLDRKSEMRCAPT